MDATQQIEDSFCVEEDGSDHEHDLEEGQGKRQPLAVLKVFKNNHIPETEVPLYQGENVIGRDPTSCSVLLQARSISGCHAVISISTFGTNDRRGHSEATEALLWDLGSLNGTRKGRFKLTPNVRYALTGGDGVVLADLPCQYVVLSDAERSTRISAADGARDQAKGPTFSSSSSEAQKGVENGLRKNALPPVPAWPDEEKSPSQTTPKKPERTLVPESDSDSDGEKHGRRDRRRIVALDSASSDLSSPTCSTFLSPANKVIPESEDESSITPSPALRGRYLKSENDHEVITDSPKPAPLLFNIDSDTDVEDEGVETTRTEATSGVGIKNPVDLHMDSDTDVEEDEIEKAKSDPKASEAPLKQDSVNPAALNMDSDTDVEEEGEMVQTDTAEKIGTVSSGQFHLESDTDEEDVPHIQDPQPETSHVAELNMNSDTNVEEEADEGTGKAAELTSDSTIDSKERIKNPDARMVGNQSDSDTDVEDDITEIRTPAGAKEIGNSQTRADIQNANERSADAQHDSLIQDQGPAQTLKDEFRLDSDTDVEEDEEKTEEKEQKCAEEAVAVQIVHSSTPRGAGLSEEDMETEAFLSPTQLFKRPVLPLLLHPSVSPGALSHTDDDFAVAETQSFVCDAAHANSVLEETPPSPGGLESGRSDGASSFQLGLSDSSHQLPETREHNREPAEDEWQLQATQLYEMKNSEGSCKAGQTQLDLDATQAYTDVTDGDVEEEGEKKEEEETQPLGALGQSGIRTAEKEQRDVDTSEHIVASEPERKTEEDEEMRVDSHLSTADTLLIVRSPRQEEQPQTAVSLTAQIQKQQEERTNEEHGTRDEEKRETEKAENENMGQGNNEGRAMKEKNEVTRDVPEEGKKQRDEEEERAQPTRTIVETLPMCEEEDGEDEEQMTEPSLNRGTLSAKVDHTRVAVAETLPMCEEEDGDDEEQLTELRSDKGTLSAKVHLAHVAVAETLPMCEEEEEEELIEPSSSRPMQHSKVESTQSLELDNPPRVAIAETLPIFEEVDGQDKEQQAEPSSSTQLQPAEVEPTQPLELDDATAETLPVCEEEDQNKPRSSKRPGRRRPPAIVVPKQSITSLQDDKEGQEGEPKSEATSTRRSSMRRNSAKAKPSESRIAILDTLPMNEEEETGQEEKPQTETKCGRTSRRGRATTKQPLKPETLKMDEEDGEQNTTRSLRGNARGRAACGKSKHVGNSAVVKKGKRGKGEQHSGSEAEVDGGNKGRRGKDLRQKSKDDDEARIEDCEEIEHSKNEKEECERLQREMEEEEARETEEREEATRLEKEREEREEHEKREQEAKDRLEKERIEREKKEREAQEMKAREENERVERERQLEKERREQEEKERQERERLERERKEREVKEKLEKEKRERQELEEELERERKKQEEEERIVREEKEREGKEKKEEKEKQKKEMGQREKEKESKGKEKCVEKEETQAPGKRKTGLGRNGKKRINEEKQELEEGTEERLETDQDFSEKQKQEGDEVGGNKREDEQAAKPRRGRRTTRKSLAPPAEAEDEGGPAKRTRSRSNSSNSVCSEQSAQDSLSEGRRRAGRKNIVEEVKVKRRVSGRTSTAPSREKEDTMQDDGSRSKSRSSDRSSSTVDQDIVVKRRKTIKAEELEEKEEEEGKQPAAVGRGRGRGRGRARGGKCPGPNDIKAEAAGEDAKPEAEATAVSEDITSQTSSRGRKRGADVSVLTPESPQLTPKTPRRSLTGLTHKVLFTGVVDEDGEKVVARLGGGLAKGVDDMTHLVTDKVRRTVKFLCAVARGVPIVTTDWLKKCGKAGSFLSPNGFLVKDVEQEMRFNFSLQDALREASSQPLLQGYEIHVTPSVKPEPAQMKEIITCCGARFLPKMPFAHKAQTVVVVSCEEDHALCERARSLSLPVVSAEFLLTGILQQKADVQTHALALLPAAVQPKPAARSRGK